MFEDLFRKKTKLKIHYENKSDRLHLFDHSFSLKPFERVFIIGVGDHAFTQAGALCFKLHNRIHGGVLMSQFDLHLPKLITKLVTPTVISSINLAATEHIAHLLHSLDEKDLVIMHLGPNSDIMLSFPTNRDIETKNKILKALTALKANSEEITTVKKHTSLIKGGQLAQIAYPATVITMIDPGRELLNPYSFADGPTVLDETTTEDAKRILHKYNILHQCQISKIDLVETPKTAKYFENVYNIPIAYA